MSPSGSVPEVARLQMVERHDGYENRYQRRTATTRQAPDGDHLRARTAQRPCSFSEEARLLTEWIPDDNGVHAFDIGAFGEAPSFPFRAYRIAKEPPSIEARRDADFLRRANRQPTTRQA